MLYGYLFISVIFILFIYPFNSFYATYAPVKILTFKTLITKALFMLIIMGLMGMNCYVFLSDETLYT